MVFVLGSINDLPCSNELGIFIDSVSWPLYSLTALIILFTYSTKFQSLVRSYALKTYLPIVLYLSYTTSHITRLFALLPFFFPVSVSRSSSILFLANLYVVSSTMFSRLNLRIQEAIFVYLLVVV
jgi:hypothetical protein